jgi:signal transduction histidine kinase/ligand-binding sensor domain-containing protein/CheY-like chemotaxis protein
MNHQFNTKLFILFFILFFQQIVVAKDYKVTQISSNDGLSQQDVECIIQDKQGFIWISTYDGLNRYDGNDFMLFRKIPGDSNSISDNRILCLKEWPERDELWIGTDGGGLNCYDLKTRKFKRFFEIYKNKNTLSDNQVSCLDKEGKDLWVGTSKGINRISYGSDNKVKIDRFSLAGVNGESVLQYSNAIAHDNIGNIIVGTFDGIYIKAPKDSEFKKVKKISGNVKQIVNDKFGNLWMVSSEGINYYSPSQQNIDNYISSPLVIKFNAENPIYLRSILAVTDKLFILTTTNKVYWLNKIDNNFTFEEVSFSDNNFFKDNTLKSLMLDRSMNIWITSGLDGVVRFDLNAKNIYHYPIPKYSKAIDKIAITTFIKDYRGRLWIGSNKGLFIEDNKKNIKPGFEGIIGDVNDIVEDKMKNVWVTTPFDIYFIPGGDDRQIISIKSQPDFSKEVPPLDGPSVLCADNRNIIWVGTRTGLLQIKRENNKFSIKLNGTKFFNSLHTTNNITRIFFNGRENSLLIGTKNSGLLKASLSAKGEIVSLQSISKSQNLKTEHIWSIFGASNGVIYIGTDSGLKKLVNKNGIQTLEPVSNDSRLQTYKIITISEDNSRNLWLNTSMGLICFNTVNKQIKSFFYTDGLSTNILTEGSLYDKSGLLYLGSIKGVNVINLSSLNTNKIFPETQLIAISINNTHMNPNDRINGRVLLKNDLEFTQKIKLKYYENNFTIEFAALHFSNPSKNRFSYRLVGFSDNWTEVNNNIRSATFTNIPPGKYTLEVKSSNCDGVWNNTSKNLTIQIAHAPWETIWAYLFYLLVIGMILYGIYKFYRDRQTLNKKLMKEYYEHSKDMEIAEVKLKYHTNITHELRTPLSLILAPAEELIAKSYEDEFINSRLNIIKRNADRLLQLISQFLDFRKVINEKYELKIGKYNLQELLSSITDSFSHSMKLKNIDLELFYDMNIKECWFDKEIVNKICYNLLSNALKNTPREGKVSIYAAQGKNDTHALISVEDTGIGINEKDIDKIFERFYQVPGTIGGTGIGLNLCKQLAEIHLGDIKVKSKLGEGTIFTLEIPITKEAFDEELISIQQPKVNDMNIEKNQVIDQNIKMNQNIEQGSETKSIILVVEDDSELRDYIVKLLANHAKVLSAENGEEGLKIANANIPDIIISDIMMPVMDGIELTQRCKNDTITSHIPIILITAKADQESEIDGLTYGADDYITKPFNPQILRLKVNNLIKLTKQRKKEGEENVGKLNERDQKFISTFEQIVLDNYSSADFGIDKICGMMFMSRMQLYRKMTAIVNKKPSQLIKEIKMKKAYKLFTEKGMNITETMYELDYTNYSYFTRQFTEVNGISPRKLLGMKD